MSSRRRNSATKHRYDVELARNDFLSLLRSSPLLSLCLSPSLVILSLIHFSSRCLFFQISFSSWGDNFRYSGRLPLQVVHTTKEKAVQSKLKTDFMLDKMVSYTAGLVAISFIISLPLHTHTSTLFIYSGSQGVNILKSDWRKAGC